MTAACAGSPPGTHIPAPVYLTDEKHITLLPTQAVENEFEIYQIIDGYYKSRTYSIEALVQTNLEEINIISFNNLGTQVYDLAYKNSDMVFHSPQATADIKPEYIVADFQLCYFPRSAVESMIREAGLIFEEIPQPDGWVRRILDGAQLIIHIQRKGNDLNYKNHLREYGYTIREESIP
ncbi:MAG: DUF3261 domain-containing protein [Spirochaetales bacterium]|nr:DUF3261 domain-containing protein [Spirochaetales bacterium]